MKKLIGSVIMLLIGLAPLSFAQQGNGQGRGENFEARIAKFKEQLQLSEQQVTEWTAIHKKYQPEMKAVRQNQELEGTAKKEKIKEIDARKDVEIKAILSESQYTQYLDLKQNKKGEGKKKKKKKKS